MNSDFQVSALGLVSAGHICCIWVKLSWPEQSWLVLTVRLQLFLSLVWWRLNPMNGECLEQCCSCASNCAHLHSPHHPQRCQELKGFPIMAHGSTRLRVEGHKGWGGQVRKAQSSAAFLHSPRAALLAAPYVVLPRLVVNHDALFMKPLLPIHSSIHCLHVI